MARLQAETAEASQADADPNNDVSFPLTVDQVDDIARAVIAEEEAVTAGHECPQWYGLAMEQGWHPEQWPTLSRVMDAESSCNPSAKNPSSSASGLLQILAGHTGPGSRCGGDRSMLFIAEWNLWCGSLVLRDQGWDAWVTY